MKVFDQVKAPLPEFGRLSEHAEPWHRKFARIVCIERRPESDRSASLKPIQVVRQRLAPAGLPAVRGSWPPRASEDEPHSEFDACGYGRALCGSSCLIAKLLCTMQHLSDVPAQTYQGSTGISSICLSLYSITFLTTILKSSCLKFVKTVCSSKEAEESHVNELEELERERERLNAQQRRPTDPS